MAEWLALRALDHEVKVSNTVGGGIKLMTVWHFVAFLITHNLNMT